MPRLLSRALSVAALALLLTACDSDDAGDNAFAGSYTGSQTVSFPGDSPPGGIHYEIRLDLGEPDAEGYFTGSAVITRSAVAGAPAQTMSGSLYGQGIEGFILSASVTGTSKSGSGVSLYMQGNVSAGRLTSRSSSISDSVYGASDAFTLTLSR